MKRVEKVVIRDNKTAHGFWVSIHSIVGKVKKLEWDVSEHGLP